MTMPRLRADFATGPGAKVTFEPSRDMLSVRTRSRRPVRGELVERVEGQPVLDAHRVLTLPEEGVEVFQVPEHSADVDTRRAALMRFADVETATTVLHVPGTKDPVLTTDNLFVQFHETVDTAACHAIISELGLVVQRELPYGLNLYFVAAPSGLGLAVFDLAEQLCSRPEVLLAYPELLRRRSERAIAPEQWHLAPTTIKGVLINAHANVAEAHKITRGDGSLIAILDCGVDTGHPEFVGRVIAPRDMLLKQDNGRPKLSSEWHGTACAGVACAAGIGASGVAPAASLMPIRVPNMIGSVEEADAIRWAVDHGADVIVCSWGPPDGVWYEPNDPAHLASWPMPKHTQLAIEDAVLRGREGKGCIVVFAAGNGNESVDLDGYASDPNVFTVAACSDRGVRSVYSDWGSAVLCAFPSDDKWHEHLNPLPRLTTGIWTTDRRAAFGYNSGTNLNGDPAGDYTATFGGTSSSAPGLAGVVALILAVNPELTVAEVREVIRATCDPIDLAGGQYDAAGHSKYYGYGRVNAGEAVRFAATL